jgi:hypothetical protein
MSLLKARDADTVNHLENKVNGVKNTGTSDKNAASIPIKKQSVPKTVTEEPGLFD